MTPTEIDLKATLQKFAEGVDGVQPSPATVEKGRRLSDAAMGLSDAPEISIAASDGNLFFYLPLRNGGLMLSELGAADGVLDIRAYYGEGADCIHPRVRLTEATEDQFLDLLRAPQQPPAEPTMVEWRYNKETFRLHLMQCYPHYLITVRLADDPEDCYFVGVGPDRMKDRHPYAILKRAYPRSMSQLQPDGTLPIYGSYSSVARAVDACCRLLLQERAQQSKRVSDIDQLRIWFQQQSQRRTNPFLRWLRPAGKSKPQRS